VIPTHKDMIRDDAPDLVYLTQKDKFDAIIEDITDCHKRGQPVLVGTTSIETSEFLSGLLKNNKIPHNVLNAKFHEREAEIIMQAGRPGTVTIATNMAGRGTDIVLGGNVSKQVDQLRGRSGRQGDPGSSQFFLSLEDDLMRLFGSDRIASIMERLGLKEGEVIQHPMITRSVQRAQRKVEENNFGIRKRLLEYDNVMNQQREVIYSRRRRALVADRIKDDILDLLEEYVQRTVEKHYDAGDIEGLQNEVRTQLLVDVPITPDDWQKGGKDGVAKAVISSATEFYRRKEEKLGLEMVARIEKMVVLQVIDEKWKDHLREMDDLKEGIHLRAYGQKDPLVEYKTEGFRMFMDLLDQINTETVGLVFKLFPAVAQPLPVRGPQRPQQIRATHEASTGLGFQANREPVAGGTGTQPPRAGKPQPIQVGEKIGRNDPCPCGSGKKYKQCHGK
jgi:preprotein translocase subunit SecA